MDKVSNISNNINIQNDNKKNVKINKHLLNEPIQDKVELTNKKKPQENKHKVLKWVLGGAVVILLGIIAKKVNSSIQRKIAMEAGKDDAKVAGEATAQEIEKIKKESAEKVKQIEEEYKPIIQKTKDDAERTKKETDKSIKKSEELQEEAKKDLKRTKEQLNYEKIENARKIKEYKEDLKRQEEEFKKFVEEMKHKIREMNENSEKFWNEYWDNFDASFILNSKDSKAKAQNAIKIFKTFGKDSNGEMFEEIKNLNKAEDLTQEIVKKIQWKLFKKYGPLINTGTEAEVMSATKIMQQINPACDDVRAYIKSK